MGSFTIFCGLLIATLAGAFSGKEYKVQKIKIDNSKMVKKLQRFEQSFTYPLSNDEQFIIQHGMNGDYFSFFKNLGKPYYYVTTMAQSKKNSQNAYSYKKGDIAGAVCCILRTLPSRHNKNLKAWYICDLKVHSQYQGQHIPMLMTKKIALARYMQCSRGFAICMNPTQGDPKAASIFKKHGPIEHLKTDTLNLYTLSFEQLQKHKRMIEQIYRNNGFLKADEQVGTMSTNGSKDYMITNIRTGQTKPWHLIHLKPGAQFYQPAPDATYMLCSVEGTGMDKNFKELLGNPSSTAQIISYGMEDVDFNILTSDQI